MENKELETKEQVTPVVEEEQLEEKAEKLDEFKASMGDPSEVPEPAAKKAKAPGKSKDQGDKTPPKQGSSEIPKSKVAMITSMVNAMNTMKYKNLSASYGNMLKAMKMEEVEESSEQDQDTVEVVENAKKVEAKDIDIKEDIKALFASDETLSEEFKDKATVIFENAVITKINEQLKIYQFDIDKEVESQKEEMKESMSKKLDEYLDYVVEQWMEDNKLAVEKGIKAELTEDFIKGLKDLFTEHYIDIPEEKADIVEELIGKNEELESKLDEEIKKNAKLNSEISEATREAIVDEVCESLTDTQAEKMRVLAENVEYTDDESFIKKLDVLKESYFKKAEQAEVQKGDFDESEPLTEETQPERKDMAVYMNAITRSVKK